MAEVPYAQEVLIRPAPIAPGKSGTLVAITRERAKWNTIDFSARRLIAGQYWQSDTEDEEAALVIFGGRATVDWGDGQREIGGRRNVFSGYPYAVYLPSRTRFE